MRLVIGRKAGEKVMVGDEVEITVLSTDRGQVRLAFEAPPHVVIDRLEVWRAKREQAAGGAA